MKGYLRSLNPQLPRSVQTLQLGGLLNALGNGLVLPFTLIYLHNERGIGLGTAGLVLGTNAAVSLVAGPIAGALVDRVGGKRMLTIALGLPDARDRRLRVRRDRLARLPRGGDRRDRQRRLLAVPVVAALRAGDARAAAHGLRDAARDDEPRDRHRRRRRRPHRRRELPARSSSSTHSRSSPTRPCSGRSCRSRDGPSAHGALGQLPRRLPPPRLHGPDGS